MLRLFKDNVVSGMKFICRRGPRGQFALMAIQLWVKNTSETLQQEDDECLQKSSDLLDLPFAFHL